MQNIEVKARLQDRGRIEAVLEAMGARPQWTRRQCDTFFVVQHGWLKLREAEGAPAELIVYQRSTADARPRPSDYAVVELGDGETWKRILGRVLGVHKVVRKERTLWLWRHSRVHLDRVEGLGDFIEIETVVDGISAAEAEDEALDLVARLGIEPEQFVAVPYCEIVP
jgi:predicted adenylyl cyclase CyaB